MKTVCEKNMCNGCMACISKCKKDAILFSDDIQYMNCFIDENKCVNCNSCYSVCPNVHPAEKKQPISCYEGWAEESIRINSSSGGVATKLMKTFIQDGGYVASCLLMDGEYRFEVTDKLDFAKQFVGSKYVKSNPDGIYEKIKNILVLNKKVLFVGLPCQVAALKNYIGENNNLYTIDLICHGSPSNKILNLYLKEKGINLKELEDLKFRVKTNFGLSTEYIDIVPNGVQDMYTHAFLNCMDYTENCYSCQFADIKRIGDITLGDSWGSKLENSEQKKGVSLILCQTKKGKLLVDENIDFIKDADLNEAIKSNHQLEHPSEKPEGREIFFDNLDKGFNKAISKASSKEYYKQTLKRLLIKMHIYHGGGEIIKYKMVYKRK